MNEQMLPPYYTENDDELPEPLVEEWEPIFVPGYYDFVPMPEELITYDNRSQES